MICPGGRLSRLLCPGGRRPARVTSRLRRPARVTSRLRRPARVTSRLRRPARVTSRLRQPARVTSRLCCLVRSTLVGSCRICPTWTWPSVPSPGSTSAPPPSWIVPSVKRLEAALWGGLCHESGYHYTTWTLAPHYSCTSLHLRLQLPSFTALTTHTFPSTIAPITQLSPITH